MNRWGLTLLGLGEAPLVLASASPRRAQILQDLGVPFILRPVNLDEEPLPGETPVAMVERLARAKAQAARPQLSEVVLAADTTVAVETRVLGKPVDDADARTMLRSLSGRRHQVHTGVAVATAVKVISGVETTEVWFRELSVGDIDALVDSGEARDKAGSYGIQGLAALCVERIEGDYSNVVGLPLGLCRRLFAALDR